MQLPDPMPEVKRDRFSWPLSVYPSSGHSDARARLELDGECAKEQDARILMVELPRHSPRCGGFRAAPPTPPRRLRPRGGRDRILSTQHVYSPQRPG